MRFRASLVLFVAFAIGASLAAAQGVGAAFQGTFRASVPNGEAVVTLVVGERVTGTLTGPGTAIDLVGDLDPTAGVVRGLATAAGESVRFEAALRGDQLTLTLFEVDADGRPIASTAVALELQRARAGRSGASATRGTPAGTPSTPPSAPPATPPASAPSSPPSEARPADPARVATLTPALVQAVHDAVEETLTLPESLMELAIDAALEAGRLGQGGLALAGTLRQLADGTLRFAPDATDALRIELLDGRSFAIAFLALPQGNLDEGGDAFVEDPHVLDVHVTGVGADGPLDLRVTSSPLAQDGTQDVRLSGRFARGGATWDVEARLERYERYVVDGIVDGEVRVQGQVALSSADLGATVTSARTYRYRIVNVVENVDHGIDTEIVLAGDRARLSGRVFVAFREALPVDRDQWVVQGGLARDGTALGAFRTSEDPSALRVVLDFQGAPLTLYTFPF
jgi:hypothetical protein